MSSSFANKSPYALTRSCWSGVIDHLFSVGYHFLRTPFIPFTPGGLSMYIVTQVSGWNLGSCSWAACALAGERRRLRGTVTSWSGPGQNTVDVSLVVLSGLLPGGRSL